MLNVYFSPQQDEYGRRIVAQGRKGRREVVVLPRARGFEVERVASGQVRNWDEYPNLFDALGEARRWLR